jgi:hypothetical protein
MATLLGPFQIAIHRLTDDNLARPLDAATRRESFAVTFEEVFAALEAWPRMFIEPDGSFVWVGQERLADGTDAAWQLDGQLYDRDERLLYLELQGTCPSAAWEQILDACHLTLPETLVEQRRAGTFIRGKEFLATQACGGDANREAV